MLGRALGVLRSSSATEGGRRIPRDGKPEKGRSEEVSRESWKWGILWLCTGRRSLWQGLSTNLEGLVPLQDTMNSMAISNTTLPLFESDMFHRIGLWSQLMALTERSWNLLDTGSGWQSQGHRGLEASSDTAQLLPNWLGCNQLPHAPASSKPQCNHNRLNTLKPRAKSSFLAPVIL